MMVVLAVVCGTSDAAPASDATLALAAHRIVPVGSSVDVAAHGTILEVASVDPIGVLTYSPSDARVTCVRGGLGIVRARYREPRGTDDNQIQTQVITCIDELGECTGQPRVSFDLELFRTEEPKGEPPPQPLHRSLISRSAARIG